MSVFDGLMRGATATPMIACWPLLSACTSPTCRRRSYPWRTTRDPPTPDQMERAQSEEAPATWPGLLRSNVTLAAGLDFQRAAAHHFKNSQSAGLRFFKDSRPHFEKFPSLLVHRHPHPARAEQEELQSRFIQCFPFVRLLQNLGIHAHYHPSRVVRREDGDPLHIGSVLNESRVVSEVADGVGVFERVDDFDQLRRAATVEEESHGLRSQAALE